MDKLISMKMPEELIKKVKDEAKKNSLTFSAMVRLILINYLNSNKEIK